MRRLPSGTVISPGISCPNETDAETLKPTPYTLPPYRKETDALNPKIKPLMPCRKETDAVCDGLHVNTATHRHDTKETTSK